MNFLKKAMVFSIALVALTVAASGAFAASTYTTPADALASLTGKTVREITSQRTSALNYCRQALDAGVLAEFKDEVYAMQKDAYALRVANGNMTQSQADSLLKAFSERQALCDGTTGNCGGGAGLCGGLYKVAGTGHGCGRGNGGARAGNGHHGGGRHANCNVQNCTYPNCPNGINR